MNVAVTDLLQMISSVLGWVINVLNLLAYWTSTFLLFLGTFWLHWKVRNGSTLTMSIGYGLATGSMGFSYVVGSAGEFDPGGFEAVPNATDLLLELLRTLGFLGFWIGVIGFFWFVSQVKPSTRKDAPSKSLNTDASDAGAG